MTRDATIPRLLSPLAVFGGVLLAIMYVGGVAGFITPARNKYTLIPSFLYGLVVHPLLYLWLARVLSGRPGPGLLGRLWARQSGKPAPAVAKSADTG